MTDDDALFAALQDARFIQLVSDRELEQRARQVQRRIRRESRREWVSGIHRWWVALVAGCALVVAGVGAAGAGLLHRQPEQQELIWCYTRVPEDLSDESARFAVVFVDPGPTTAQQALDACFAKGDGTIRPIPELVSECVLQDGSVAVLPIGKCSDVGLPASDLAPIPDE